ncbi:hypothetical protein SPFM7_00268 [Salmonella phage SPFM7]|nr:hypothetical protein SPFM7_00268 [Salmonella phage SPFM7]
MPPEQAWRGVSVCLRWNRVVVGDYGAYLLSVYQQHLNGFDKVRAATIGEGLVARYRYRPLPKKVREEASAPLFFFTGGCMQHPILAYIDWEDGDPCSELGATC